MGKNPAKKAKQAPPLSADRLRAGWQGPAGTRIHLARPQDAAAADALMATTGEEMRFTSVLRRAIEDGSASSTMVAGIGGENAYREAAVHTFSTLTLDRASTTVCLTLVATDEHDCVVGVLSGTAPGTIMSMAASNGYSPAQARVLSLVIAKVHGLAVAEHTRGQGIATALLKRAWQVYQQLGYLLLYGSYEADRDLTAFYTRSGYTVHAPGALLSLERLSLPFRVGAGPDECLFTRWRPRR
ncbi:GNAT family N-acetyltransferase [Kitasatospora sp. NBC_01300]|uniref:GNAT family N-acetyltransferase n=1 Tax=Kitasatospora sp. NBC_01300 TaxID=2903574 RepID=UPI002F90FDC1|nr:GNAT family N-acetyltransferase [Kitasatospora sp. NBC_01300]